MWPKFTGENEKTPVKRQAHRRGKEPITILIELWKPAETDAHTKITLRGNGRSINAHVPGALYSRAYRM